MLGFRAAIILLAGLFLADPSAAAPAKTDHHTQWYTIGIQASASSAPLFLTNEGAGPVFEPYRSGDVTQMWTTVADFYPNSAPVTSDSGIGLSDIVGGVTGMIGCVNHWPPGCGFSVSIRLPPVKIVNRAGTGCLILNSSKALMTPCVSGGSGLAQQRWFVIPDKGGSGLVKLGTNNGCLSAPKARDSKYLAPGSVSCTKVPPGSQELLVLQLAADLQCRTGYWEICFVDGQQ